MTQELQEAPQESQQPREPQPESSQSKKKSKKGGRVQRGQRMGIPLRVALLFVTVIVAGVGLLASAVAIQQAMYEVAFSRVDEDLEWGLKGWARNEQLYQYDDRYVSVLPSDFFVYRLYKEGEYRVQNGYKEVSLPAMREIQFDGKAHTVKSQDGQTDWRVLAGTYEDSRSATNKSC